MSLARVLSSRCTRLALTQSFACTQQQRRGILTIKSVKYQTQATSDAEGRNGKTVLNDEPALSLTMALPKEMGGKGNGSNPEQLFSMGYAACFAGAMQVVAQKMKKKVPNEASVTVRTSIGDAEGKEGPALAVKILVAGVDDELVKATHKFCPYSRALEEGISIELEAK